MSNPNAIEKNTAALRRPSHERSGARNERGEYEHPFWYICSRLPSSYWNYDDTRIDFNTDLSAYELIQKIGRGKYSEVFRCRNTDNNCICVLKILKPVRFGKIKREISILRNLCGGPNVVRLLDVLKDERTGTPVLVTEYVNKPVTLRTLMQNKTLTNFDLRYYIYEVLRCLDFAHCRGIFHRDIKPHNVMIDAERKILRVIDWGLGEYYIHGEALNCGVATRHYKSPELLFGYRHYDYSLDIWCVGCVLAGMLFRCDPLFCG
ncbi:casein kinase II subunit alpha, partial [Angomonas deanei]